MVVLGLAGAGSLLLFSDYSTFSSLYFAPIMFFVSSLTFLPLLVVDGLYLSSGRVQRRIIFSLLVFGVLATSLSALFTTLAIPANRCAAGVSGGGFPLPWHLSLVPYSGAFSSPLCPLILNRTAGWIGFPIFSFLYDVVFYAGFGIAVNELYKRTRARIASRERGEGRSIV